MKLPDPRVPCQCRWSPGYSPNADTVPGGICAVLGHFVVVCARSAVSCCSHHEGVITDRLRERGAQFFVWYRLKRSWKLCWSNP